MFEVILYAAIATIVCVMLYTVLGKSVGHGEDNPVDIFNDDQPDAPKIIEPVIETSSVDGMGAVIALDKGFRQKEFVEGAKTAYVMILEAFADGDKETLKSLLVDDVYNVYANAIEAREDLGHRQVTDLGRLIGAKIVQGETDGKWMRVSVEYEAELASSIVDAEGELVEGDPDVLANVSEIWTYTRKAGSSDPNWLLADVAPSTGDELEADPTPDTSA
ncbi:Tim44/TimA family putative adaptor protein [Fretibacter rubidus]|uniref:Tim44/TimA family putative adaptor protein n=1 Tax=Fretibacter rubidus TaxID=570162 RepID=UPI00352AEB2A